MDAIGADGTLFKKAFAMAQAQVRNIIIYLYSHVTNGDEGLLVVRRQSDFEWIALTLRSRRCFTGTIVGTYHILSLRCVYHNGWVIGFKQSFLYQFFVDQAVHGISPENTQNIPPMIRSSLIY